MVLPELLLSMNLIKTPIKWLTSQDWVMVAVTILAVWGGLGNYMLYFYHRNEQCGRGCI